MVFSGMSVTSSFRAHGHESQPQEHDPWSGEQPLWRVDLRSFGLTRANTWNITSAFLAVGPPDNGPISFIDNTQMVTVFSTPESEAQFSPRRLHALFLSSATGRVMNTSEWSGRFQQIGLLPLQNGRFVVRASHEVTLYSTEGTSLAKFEIPQSIRHKDEQWGVFTGPSGASVLVVHRVDCSVEIQWLDPASLEIKRRWMDQEGAFSFGMDNHLDVSGDWLVATLRFPARRCGAPKTSILQNLSQAHQEKWCEIAVRNFEGPWHTIFRQQGYCASGAEFLNDRTIAFASNQQLQLFDADGEVVLNEKLGSHEFTNITEMRHSSNGRQVAVPIFTSKGGSEMLDIGPHSVLKRVMVYDLTTRRFVYKLDAKKEKIKSLSGLAVSPDGSLLAVLADGVLRAYRFHPSGDQ